MEVALMSEMVSPSRPIVCRICAVVLGLLLAAAALPASAQVTGISYTLAPMAERIYFDKNAGLEDGTFFGGRIGFGFGEYTELSGVYRVSSGLSTDFSDFADLGSVVQERFEMLPPRDLNARMYGAELKFNLGRGAVFPLLSLGTGILEFDPENLDESRHIYLTGAAGLQLAFGDHFSLLAQVEDLIYRYTPTNALLSQNDVSDLGLEPTDFRQVNVNNLVVRVGLQMYVGGRARGELTDADLALRRQFSGGLSGIRLQIEPIGGMISFSDDLGFRERQRMAGVLAGLDLGPFLGVRGFYWRGVEEDAYTDFANLQSYGGELRLRFGEIASFLIPHLILGGGYLDVLSGYEGNGAIEAVDRPFATGGVGFNIPLTGAIQANAAVRSLLISADDAENVTGPSQLTANLFYSAGIRFGLGGGRPDLPATEPRRTVVEREVVERDVDSGIEAELSRVQEQVDSLQTALERSMRLPPGAVGPSEAEPREVRAGSEFVTIPVPEEGEFYVRYGGSGAPSRFESNAPGVTYVDPMTGEVVERAATPPTSGDEPLTAEEIREIVREVMSRQLEARQAPRTEGESETVRRLRSRIEELEDRLEAETAGPARVTPVRDRARRADTGRAGYELETIVPFVGFGLSENQLGVAGLRAELRSRSLTGVRFLPELVASAGTDGVSYGLNAGAAFPFGVQAGSLRPYAGLGLGIMTADGLELVFNLFAGVEQSGFGGRFFAEYMSQDFFDLNRFVVGYRLSI